MKNNKIDLCKLRILIDRLLIVLSIEIILLTRIWNIVELNGPFVFDETGYWAHAANMSGLSWTEIIPYWYSYGYSLLLVPLFCISHNMNILYRMAIVLNVVMGIFSFFLGKAIIQEIDVKYNGLTSSIISLVATSYSAYIYQANVTWAETFIYTWFLLIIWSSIKFFKKSTWCNTLIITLECLFLSLIHNRCIVVFIAYAIVLIYMAFQKKINWRKIVVVVLLATIVYSVNSSIKDRLYGLMWETNEGEILNEPLNTIISDTEIENVETEGITTGNTESEVDITENIEIEHIETDNNSGGFVRNDVSSHIGKLKLLFRFDGWISLLKSFAGKAWYIFSSTLMLAYMGLIYVCVQFIKSVKQRNNFDEKWHYFYLFVGLTICGTVAMSTISMLPDPVDYTQSTRIDPYFYGRYSDMISGILIIFGLLHLDSRIKKGLCVTECVIGAVIYLILGYVLYLQIDDIVSFHIYTVCAPGVCFFKSFSCIDCSIAVLLAFIIGNIIIFLISNLRKNKQAVKKIFCSILIIVSFWNTSQNAYETYNQLYQKHNKQINGISELLNENVQYPIYCLSEYDQKAIRTKVVEGKIDYDIPEQLDKDCFIVMDIGKEIDLDREDVYLAGTNGELLVIIVGDKLASKVQAEGYICYKADHMDYVFFELSLNQEMNNRVVWGEQLTANVTVKKNYSDLFMGDSIYSLSYRIYDQKENGIIWDAEGVAINILEEEEVPIIVDTRKLVPGEQYIIEIDVLEKDMRWLSDTEGVETIRREFTVVDK